MFFFVLFFKEKYSFCLLVIGSRVPKTSEPIISKEPCAVVLGTERNVSSQDTSHKSMGMKLPGMSGRHSKGWGMLERKYRVL